MLDFTLTKYSKLPLNAVVGYIKYFIYETDDRPAVEQFNERYRHGGGWNPFDGFTMDNNLFITYPEDSALPPLAIANFREQKIIIYPHSFVAILNPDKTFEVSRMD